MNRRSTISADALDAMIAEDSVTVLDVRWDDDNRPDEFAAAHIPTAQYVDLELDLAGPPGAGGRLPLPDPHAFIRTMRSLGVSSNRAVVAYDDNGSGSAARAWWLLRHYGHRDVRVLDGGLESWRHDGRGLVTGQSPATVPGDFQGMPGVMPVLDATEVLKFAEHHLLADAREPSRHRGDAEPLDPVAGHVPGSVNVPVHHFFDETGRLLPPEYTRSLLREAGVDGETPVGLYCGSGLAATLEVLVLDSIGIRAALYPGSWSHWVTDPARPVAVGTD